nr:cytochrome P450 [Stackebrandtia nassauensis]
MTDGDLFRLWRIRRDEAVWRQDGHVVVADPALVRRVLTDPAGFAPANALDAVTPIPATALRILASHGFRLPVTLANNGTDSHPGLRQIVADAMTPRRVEALRPWLTGVVRRRVSGVVHELRDGRSVDLYQRLAADIPLLVLARLVELPVDDVSVVKLFSRSALELFWARPDTARQRELATVVGEHHRWLREVARTGPGLVARLREHCDREGLGEDHVVAALFFLVVAGQETTSQFLTLLLARLAAEPRVREDLVAGVVSAESVVEEGLRLVPPIVSWRRTATVDADLGGCGVRAGDSVLLWLAEAGRRVAADGDAFAPGQRGSRRHLAFGAGAHRCTGAQLARMEAQVVLAESAPLLRGTRVEAEPRCPANLSFRMPDRLVVRRVQEGWIQPEARARNSSGDRLPAPSGMIPARP